MKTKFNITKWVGQLLKTETAIAFPFEIEITDCLKFGWVVVI